MKKLLVLSLTVYTILIAVFAYLGGYWSYAIILFVAGILYDVISYIRLRKGQSILTYKGIIK